MNTKAIHLFFMEETNQVISHFGFLYKGSLGNRLIHIYGPSVTVRSDCAEDVFSDYFKTQHITKIFYRSQVTE